MGKMKSALLVTTLAVGVALTGGSAYAADLMHAAAPGVVQAPAGAYVSVFAGAAFATDPTGTAYDYTMQLPLSTGFIIGGAVGTHIAPNLRGELELSYASHNVGSTWTWDDSTYTTGTGSVSTLYALGNIWYDIDLGGSFTPYIGGGAGLAVVMPNTTIDGSYTYNGSGVAPAAQVGGGVKFQLADNMAIDVGYRAKAVFNSTWFTPYEPAHDMSWIDQTVQVGLTIGF